MSLRKFREAAIAKRASPDDIALASSFGYTPEQLADIDTAYANSKTDPAAIAQREHKALTEQVQMLRIMSRSM